MSAQELENYLWAIVESYGPIAPDCNDLLRDLIHKGALQVESQGELTNQSKIDLAEKNTRMLLDTMKIFAIQSGVPELHEFTFGSALQKLCPIFPFC